MCPWAREVMTPSLPIPVPFLYDAEGGLGVGDVSGSRACQRLRWGLWRLLGSTSTDTFRPSTYFSVCEMNPSGFSPLRNFRVAAFFSGKLSAGREGRRSPLLPPSAPQAASQGSSTIFSGGWRGLWQTLNLTQHIRTFLKEKYYNFSSLDKMRMTTAKNRETGQPQQSQVGVVPGPSRLPPAADSADRGCALTVPATEAPSNSAVHLARKAQSFANTSVTVGAS